MRRVKGLKIYVLITMVIILGLIIGPNFKWFNPARWWGQTLIVLMNENEARPCGGFVTAYGVVNIPFGGVELNNSFAFPAVNLGLNEEPLRQVSPDKKFWDLGTTADKNRCGQAFVSAYERATDNYPDRVYLMQSGVLEAYLEALGPVQAGDLTLSADNFFGLTSRLVADIDRHDEQALADRKNPLHLFGKRIIVTTLLRPWRWHAVSQVIHKAELQGELYWHRPGLDKVPRWQAHVDRTITITEWNLGGGKSSRYLDKQWTVFLKQVSPTSWQVENRIEVTHLGQEDKPLSQAWRGGFEIHFMNQAIRFIPAEIQAGNTFKHTETFTLSHQELFSFINSLGPTQARFNLFAPPYQDWQLQLQISALAQQNLVPVSRNLTARESSATWRGESSFDGEPFSFELVPDTLAPFLTWHKPLLEPSEEITDLLALETGDIVVELHFNEPAIFPQSNSELLDSGQRLFTGENLNIVLEDRDFEVPDITADMSVEAGVLLADQTTLLLKVRPEPYQLNERYYLEITGVADQWGNEAKITKRTVITR